ncbi:hypothetical protein PAXRUDRAFT_446817 [Paxillus rubicundulus Ve08.2h10]|uniref:Uncharacterized protein n=1 Tax=Paxillus rubicundulus Ve08.2h10 TaxID=930991 RepID=A0A0D0DWZ3_9AGAM|nr:hypothetical protein PAXRUDRAFT_446817 [Paxillus rubicundulus Ve08.2h10]
MAYDVCLSNSTYMRNADRSCGSMMTLIRVRLIKRVWISFHFNRTPSFYNLSTQPVEFVLLCKVVATTAEQLRPTLPQSPRSLWNQGLPSILQRPPQACTVLTT